MTRIKICGITRLEDALEAAHAGADALGFNFSRTSPRFITPEKAKAIIEKLPPFIQSAGIFVDHSPDDINTICSFCRLQIAQLHSSQYSPEQARSISEAHVIKVFQPKEDFAAEEVFDYARKSGVRAFLFDACLPGMAGGTGKCIGTSLATRIFSEIESSLYAILAGGLNDKNVGESILRIRPYGVDTASGVEKEPGIKDAALMKAFIRAVRESGS